MFWNIFFGLMIPFIGTSFGAACVLFMDREFNIAIQKALTGFAAGVMVAASIWSLLIPALEQSTFLGELTFLPAVAGFWVGIIFLLVLDTLIPHFHKNCDVQEGIPCKLKKITMMIIAITIHNVPEGIAVGIVYAGIICNNNKITLAGAFALSMGIAIQNFPEGAIVSMPLCAQGVDKITAFKYGVVSGAIEPLAGLMTILLFRIISPAMPFLLSFAAGAMMYVVVDDLVPEMSVGEHSNLGTIFFAVGFTVMMSLDVALSH